MAYFCVEGSIACTAVHAQNTAKITSEATLGTRSLTRSIFENKNYKFYCITLQTLILFFDLGL